MKRCCVVLLVFLSAVSLGAQSNMQQVLTRAAQITQLLKEGQRLGKEGRRQEALDCFLQVMRLDPSNIEGCYYAGVACLHLGKYADAVKEHDRLKDIVAWLKKASKFCDVSRHYNLAKRAQLLLWHQLKSEGAKQDDGSGKELDAWLRSVAKQQNITLRDSGGK